MSFLSSSTSWESSIYGGFYNVIWDYPYIREPNNLEFKIAEAKYRNGVQEYTVRKLFKIFLSECNNTLKSEYASMIQHPDAYSFEKIEKKSSFSFFKSTEKDSDKKKYIHRYTLRPEIVKELYEKITSDGSKSELKSMFQHFELSIINSSVYIDFEPDNNSDKKKDSITDIESDEISDISKQLLKIDKKLADSPYSTFDQISNPNLKKNTKFVLVRNADAKFHIDSESESIANNILRKLDIDLDPKSDKITSLRSGKLQVEKIACALSGDDKIYYRVEEDVTTRPFKVCILMDESGSMHRDGEIVQREIIKILHATFSKILPGKDIFIYGHSSYNKNEYPQIRIYNDNNYPDGFLNKFCNQFKQYPYGENYDGPVIECVYEHIRAITQDNILFISISDGYPAGINYGGRTAMNEMKQIIEKCKRDGFVTIGIGISGFGGVKDIYNYNTVIPGIQESYNEHLIKQLVPLINRVVKTEFQT